MIKYYKEQQIFSMADVIWMNGLEEATRQGATRQHGTRHKARGKRRQGNWEAFGPKGQKAGDSKISLILDSCIILEEWTSAPLQKNLRFQGKSFNTYNAQTKQWQQTWVDNTGNTTHYLKGRAETNRIIFETLPPSDPQDTTGINRLTFSRLDGDKVRQLGEVSKDNGKTWTTQYDLEYRRKKDPDR